MPRIIYTSPHGENARVRDAKKDEYTPTVPTLLSTTLRTLLPTTNSNTITDIPIQAI